MWRIFLSSIKKSHKVASIIDINDRQNSACVNDFVTQISLREIAQDILPFSYRFIKIAIKIRIRKDHNAVEIYIHLYRIKLHQHPPLPFDLYHSTNFP